MKTQILAIIILISCSAFAFDNKPDHTPRHYKIADGSEIYHAPSDFHPNFVAHNYPSVMGTIAEYTFHVIPGANTIYDIQSNAVPNEIWQDPLIPLNVHAVFMYSRVPGFSSRACAYLFSNDGGNFWQNLDSVPSNGRYGFPSISGTGSGAAIIANQLTPVGTSAISKLSLDAGAGFGIFTTLSLPDDILPTLWPRALGIGNSKILIAVEGNMISYNGVFSSWQPFPGSGAESYFISRAPNGIVGHVYLGLSATDDEYDAFYRYSSDDGVTWSVSQKIWNWDNVDSLGVLKGISLVFGNNNDPYAAFEVSKLGSNVFYPGLPSSIRVWSPNVNGGIPKIIADNTNVPFYPNRGNVSDAFLPICRPAIGRSSIGSDLYVAFNATTGQYGIDTSSYYSAWFAISFDGGNNWNRERMTPVTPLRDWRYISISQVNYSLGNGSRRVQMICQDDSIPGAYVYGAPVGNAQPINIRFDLEVFVHTISSIVPERYNLQQNYPNPFNPSTSIRFDITKQSNVTLKVYNSNGQEVETLVDNETVTPGTKEVFFDGNNLSSGIYFYTLTAGEFKETKKMILLK